MRRRTLVLGLAVPVLAAAVAVTGLELKRAEPAAAVSAELPPATAVVTRQNLVDTRIAQGTVGYGTSSTFVAQATGIVTWLPDIGSTITRGQRLYGVNDVPVVLMYGPLPAYRAMRPGEKGDDVRQFEQNLKALGYSYIDTSGTYTSATAAIVRRWQAHVGLPVTGQVDLGQVAFVPDALRVASLNVTLGGTASAGQPIMAYTGTTRVITVELDQSDQGLAAKGTNVTILIPDGTTLPGTITGATVIVPPSGSSGSADSADSSAPNAKIDVSITAAQLSGAATAVQVSFIASQRSNVLAVPVAALVALAEGGYGVQVVDGARTRYVPVETGLFANGQVEVSGPGLAPGVVVGMPR